MLERLAVVAVVMGGLAFTTYQVLRGRGWDVEEARNSVVLLLVLSENVLALSARSETRSLFRTGLRGNRVLAIGVIAALGIHVAAMYLPFTQRVLGLAPVPVAEWLVLVAVVLVLLAAVEAHKLAVRRRGRPR